MFRRLRTRLLPPDLLSSTRLGYLLGALTTVGVGLFLLLPLLGDGLARFSYDIPFLFRNSVPDDLVMVYFDAGVKQRLGQPTDQPLDRRVHARLLERLAAEGARLVLLDVLFDQPGPDPEADEVLARAIQKQGHVVLVAESVNAVQALALTESTIQPLPALRNAAASYGLANVDNDVADSAVRRLDAGTDNSPSGSWVAARLLDSDATRPPVERLVHRWLYYYCAPDDLKKVNLDQALEPRGLGDGYFHDKLVVVGSKPENLTRQPGREEFANPYSRFGRAFSPGAAVHAISLLNFLRGDWLQQLSSGTQSWIVVVWGVAIGCLLMRLSPWSSIGAAIVAASLWAVAAICVQLYWHRWFSWVVPAAAQTGAAMVWSVGYQYLVESRRRQRLLRALAAYVSPAIAERVANAGFDLSPGGKEVEATVMFTDLENFMKLSEGLAPAEVSRILIAYFRETQRAIFEQDGTVIKFIGDAVMAAWGAPLPDPNPAERAVMAALNMRQTGRTKIEGRHLRTRIGINSGLVLAGNLGTETKLDYTLIGDAINIAARLETLNKQLGTDILISEASRAALSSRIQLRDLGRFVLSGKTNPVGIYEVVAIATAPVERPPWLAAFDEARARFVEGDFTHAEVLFQNVMKLHDGLDGPARFFLEQIRIQRPCFSPDSWDGIIRLDTK